MQREETVTQAPAEPDAAFWHGTIAVAAYYRAERRDFAPWGELADWLAAEAAIDGLLAASARSQRGHEEQTKRGVAMKGKEPVQDRVCGMVVESKAS